MACGLGDGYGHAHSRADGFHKLARALRILGGNSRQRSDPKHGASQLADYVLHVGDRLSLSRVDNKRGYAQFRARSDRDRDLRTLIHEPEQ